MNNRFLLIWRYGLPFVSPNNLLVSTINGTGAVIEFVYVTIFLIYAPKKVKSHMMGLLALVVTIFTSVALVSVLAIHGQTRKVFCGSAAVIFSVCMYGSPLAVMVMQILCWKSFIDIIFKYFIYVIFSFYV